MLNSNELSLLESGKVSFVGYFGEGEKKLKYRVSRIDMDTLFALFLVGFNPTEDQLEVGGDAPKSKLRCSEILTVECGMLGEVEDEGYHPPLPDEQEMQRWLKMGELRYNNADHHIQAQGNRKVVGACASMQLLSRQFRLAQYVELYDTARMGSSGFKGPSLSSIISGMLASVSVREPLERIKWAHAIFKHVLFLDLDPFQDSMVPLFEYLPETKWFAFRRKWIAKRLSEDMEQASFETHNYSGFELGSVESIFFGAPGELQGRGADIAVALNPKFEAADGTLVFKASIGSRRAKIGEQGQKDLRLVGLAEYLDTLEIERGGKGGWGGPEHKTFIGSPQKEGTKLSLSELSQAVKNWLDQSGVTKESLGW